MPPKPEIQNPVCARAVFLDRDGVISRALERDGLAVSTDKFG